MIHNCNNINWD